MFNTSFLHNCQCRTASNLGNIILRNPPTPSMWAGMSLCDPPLSLLRNLAVMSAEERRLEAEEGSLSKNTWQRKKEDIEAG